MLKPMQFQSIHALRVSGDMQSQLYQATLVPMGMDRWHFNALVTNNASGQAAMELALTQDQITLNGQLITTKQRPLVNRLVQKAWEHHRGGWKYLLHGVLDAKDWLIGNKIHLQAVQSQFREALKSQPALG
jgi:hypothetical protein